FILLHVFLSLSMHLVPVYIAACVSVLSVHLVPVYIAACVFVVVNASCSSLYCCMCFCHCQCILCQFILLHVFLSCQCILCQFILLHVFLSLSMHLVPVYIAACVSVIVNASCASLYCCMCFCLVSASCASLYCCM